MKDYIYYFTADGTLNMPDSDKPLFREWAQQQLSNAYPDFSIEIKQERSAFIFLTSETNYKRKKNMFSFINNLHSRWERVNKKERIVSQVG